jgi:hypothetical protein
MASLAANAAPRRAFAVQVCHGRPTRDLCQKLFPFGDRALQGGARDVCVCVCVCVCACVRGGHFFELYVYVHVR